MTGRRSRVRLLALLVLCACGDEAPSPCAVAPSHERHACVHAREGPYAALDGRAHPIPLASETHTHYTVTLAADGAGSFSGHVEFRAPRSGCWAFFVAGVERLLPESACRPHRGFHASAAVTACQELDRVFTLSMAGGERVRLAVRASQPRAGLLVERLSSRPGEGEAEPPARECSGESVKGDGGPADTTLARPPADAGAWEVMADDASPWSPLDGPPRSDASPGICRASGPCSRDEECCEYCHDGDHCH